MDKLCFCMVLSSIYQGRQFEKKYEAYPVQMMNSMPLIIYHVGAPSHKTVFKFLLLFFYGKWSYDSNQNFNYPPLVLYMWLNGMP